MILSMTGYGTGSAQRDGAAVTVEIRTVNHRFLDVHIRLSREYGFLETGIQQAVRNRLGRGRVDVNVAIQGASPAAFLVNADSARSYIEAAGKLRDEFRLEDSLDLRTLLTLPGVLQNRDSAPNENSVLQELLDESLRQALEGVMRMREQEGKALQADMKGYLEGIGGNAACVHSLAPATVVEYRKKLEERLAQLLPQNGIDPQRVAQEVALLAERCDISEEIARLESHVEQYMSLMDTGKEVGKELDFLLQEMQREANTILSKSAKLEITRLAISIKADIEKLREQVQNVE
jgi:uncharacterized protein (TIGR00255 family)